MALVAAALLLLPHLPALSSAVTLDTFANSALVAPPAQRLSLPTLSFSLPAGPSFLSAEATATFSPRLPAGAQFDLQCAFSGVARVFVWLDDHLVCQFGAFNNSVNGRMDSRGFTMRSRAALPLRAHVYPLPGGGGGGNVSLELRWCPAPAGACVPLPADALDAALPAPELARRALQQDAAAGWGSWLHRDILSIVLLPDSAVVTPQLCHLPTGLCLEGTQIDGNSGGPAPAVRVGAHAVNHSYSQAFVAFLGLNVSVEFAVSGGGRDLDLTVAPQANSVNLEEYAVVFAGRFAWGRLGAFTAHSNGLQFAGAGLSQGALWVTAAPLPASALPEIHAPGLPYLVPCQWDRQCASELCTCNGNGCLGLCEKETPLVFFAAALPAGGAVGLSTRANASLVDIEARIAVAREAELASYLRFGADAAVVTEAVTAALGWSNIWVPVESGPTITTSFGFTWISPAPTSFDDAYVTFAWDNIFMAFEAGVLGSRAAAYSSLICVLKSKTNDGLVPNWASGGSKSSQSEPAIGARVLLDLFRRFGDLWLVELLFDDLLDWSEWQWQRRRFVVPGSSCCDEPGFISVGDDDSSCVSARDCVSDFRGESGLDQSPRWDCVGAAPDGSGGDCEGFAVNTSRVLQFGDTQAVSLFVVDADALATLAALTNRSAVQAMLRGRADAMRAQLARLWDDSQQAFMDLYARRGANGTFSTRLSPTSFYPLMAGAASAAQATAMVGHLLNASEFCVAEPFTLDANASCYWGLPSIAASDRAYMQPLSYVYWRGLVWGPMSMLTYWALDAVRAISPAAAAAAATLAAQKSAQMTDMWMRQRHICENYSPFSPENARPPGVNNGVNTTNGECTGWQWYAWGALNGVLALLEAARVSPAE